MERSMDADFSAVRIHEGPQASAMGALAYTQGTEIHFAPGRYDPHGQDGQQLLGHELAHVVQQSQGRVPVTAQAKAEDGAVALNDDAALEREADEMGARAARGEGGRGGALQDTAHAAGPVQQFREYTKTPGGKGGGNGQGFGMVKEAGYHVKYHPMGGPWGGKMWQEFHVTFELFDDDTRCPKVYYRDDGTRLAGHDGDQVNRRYRDFSEGKDRPDGSGTYPLFADLIDVARGHADAFLQAADATAPFLAPQAAQARMLEIEAEEQHQQQVREEDDKLHGASRKDHDKQQSSSFGQSYSEDSPQLKLFGSSSVDNRDEILKAVGVERWLWAKIKNTLWDRPRSEWGEMDKYFDAVQRERVAREPKPPVVSSGSSQDHGTSEVTSTTSQQVAQSVEQSGLAPDEIEEVARDLPLVEGPPDHAQLMRIGIPIALIGVILAIGIPLFLRILGQLG
jgi:hypothetical protein